MRVYAVCWVLSRYASSLSIIRQMDNNMTKSVFGVSDQIQHKPGSTATEDGQRLKISDLRRRRIALSSVYRCGKNKGADQLRRYGAADLHL